MQGVVVRAVGKADATSREGKHTQSRRLIYPDKKVKSARCLRWITLMVHLSRTVASGDTYGRSRRCDRMCKASRIDEGAVATSRAVQREYTHRGSGHLRLVARPATSFAAGRDEWVWPRVHMNREIILWRFTLLPLFRGKHHLLN